MDCVDWFSSNVILSGNLTVFRIFTSSSTGENVGTVHLRSQKILVLYHCHSIMYNFNEGEILLNEKYGSNTREITYVKPPDQGIVVILDEKKTGSVSNWFARIFLPQGYPNSVSGDYSDYQVWDTAQAFCSTITGILATQEVLRGVGVGDTSATPLAATITWVIKDGFGHLGKILFAFTHGTYLDAYSKKWRLYADTINDAAMCIEIALPLFKSYTTLVLSVSTVMKAIVGVAGGATRVAMTQHHAIRGNIADVSAKDAAQETAVNLFASFTALLIIIIFGNSLIVFLLMIILHITFNYLAVRAVCLRTLNEPRFLQLLDVYLRRELIAPPCEINRNEPIIFYNFGPNLLDLKLCGFQIKLGHSIKKMIFNTPDAWFLKKIKDVYVKRIYILLPDIFNRKMYVLVKEGASSDELLCAYFHAVLLSIITCAINEEPLTIYLNDGPFAQLCQAMQSADWSRELVDTHVMPLSGFAHNPSIELMKYLDSIVHKEWRRIREALVYIGWDLSKHLLVVDEWRVSRDILSNKPVLHENNQINIHTRANVDGNNDNLRYEDVVNELNSDEILHVEEITVEPEITVPKRESGKLLLEAKSEPAKAMPLVNVQNENTDDIESLTSKLDSGKQKKKD